MKFIILTLLFPFLAQAQSSVDVKNVDAEADSTTTIQVHKGPVDPLAKPAPQWEVQDGTADIEGEISATARDAKKAWQKACADWKKDFREDNKENKVVSTNCGVAQCSGEAGSKICTSNATYKIKTRVD